MKEVVIPNPYTQVEKDENGAIPFDPELWEECQNAKFFSVEGIDNTLAFPKKLQGRCFDPSKEKELRQDLYALRVMTKVNKEVRQREEKG